METDRRTMAIDDPVVVGLVVKTDDHETRLRAGEKFRYTIAGAVGMLAFLFPTTVGAVVAVLASK